jgi:hypothetical protein
MKLLSEKLDAKYKYKGKIRQNKVQDSPISELG